MKMIKMNQETKASLAEKLEKFKEGILESFGTKKGLPDSVKFDFPLGKIGTLKDKEKVQVVFTNEVYKKMMALVNKASKEVGWYGSARRESDKRFVIYDIYLPPQKVTGATVETDDEEYALWSAGLTDEQFTNMKFFGHSHVYMGVTPSGVDTTFQENILQNTEDFYIFGIFNKSKSWWINVYDVKNNVLYEKEDIDYLYQGDDAEDWAKDQIEKKVKEQTYAVPVKTKNTSNSTRYDFDDDDDDGWEYYNRLRRGRNYL